MKDDLLIGVHSVGEWLGSAPERLIEILALPRPNERVSKLLRRAVVAQIPVKTVQPRDLKALAGPRNHQGIAALVKAFPYADLDEVLASAGPAPLLLGVDGVTDPGNLGAIIRSAAFFGAAAVLLPQDKSAPMTPVTERSAAGAAARMPLCRLNNMRREVERLQQKGFRVVASVVGPHPEPASLPLDGPIILLVGSEGKGLRAILRKVADYKTSLPTHGPESLNVSAFTSTLLYEAWRQRRTDTPSTDTSIST
jgi:23S rRNA (guanosine2251-2'-O)-methyltransferase